MPHGCAVTISETLDGLPLGRFHALHLARQIFMCAAFSACAEMTPYLFPGLASEFSVDRDHLGIFAAAFPAGCVLGTCGAALLLDSQGRRPGMVLGAAAAAVAGFAMAFTPPGFLSFSNLV